MYVFNSSIKPSNILCPIIIWSMSIILYVIINRYCFLKNVIYVLCIIV